MADLGADFVIRTEGLEEIDNALRQLPVEIADKVIIGALADGAEVLRGAIEAGAPVQSGQLAAVVTARTQKGDRSAAYSLIGFMYHGLVAKSSRRKGKAPTTQDPGVYWKWVEFGRPGANGHTHQAAQPFVRPAFDGESEAAIETFALSAAERLDAAIDQVAAGKK